MGSPGVEGEEVLLLLLVVTLLLSVRRCCSFLTGTSQEVSGSNPALGVSMYCYEESCKSAAIYTVPCLLNVTGCWGDTVALSTDRFNV